MATLSLVTPVFMSKAEALAVLSEKLGLESSVDDPADVTLPLRNGAWISIEVPKFGEDLPLTLDVHHSAAKELAEIVAELQENLRTKLAWNTLVVG